MLKRNSEKAFVIFIVLTFTFTFTSLHILFIERYSTVNKTFKYYSHQFNYQCRNYYFVCPLFMIYLATGYLTECMIEITKTFRIEKKKRCKSNFRKIFIELMIISFIPFSIHITI